MNRKSSTSIQHQLQLFFVLTLGFTVLIMGGVWIGYNQVLLEKEAERVLIVESDIIGAAARPALMFNDQRMAGELLRTMRFDPDVSLVKLFTNDGNNLFTYAAEDDTAVRGEEVAFQASQSSSFSDGRLRLFRVIAHKGEPVGVIYLESRLNHLKESQYAGLITVIVVMAGCLMLGLMLASRLQKKIATPISSLAQLMREMGEGRDYSLRVDSRSYNRETEDLLVGFNQMAEEVQNSFNTIEEKHKQLKESEQRFRNIVELAPMPVVISRQSDGQVLFYNGAAAQLLGVDIHVTEGVHTLDFYRYPEERPKLLKKLMDTGSFVGLEMAAVRRDGAPLWISLSMSQITFEGEAALFSAFVDITDQKSIEKRLEEQVSERTQELRQTRDELQSTLDNMLDTYYRLSSDGVVVWASNSVHSLLGYSAEQVTGMPLEALWVDGCDFSLAAAALAETDGVLMNHKVQLKHKDGFELWTSISAHLIMDQQQKVVGIEGVIRDITLLVQAEERKQALEETMAHVQRLESLGVLAGGIAHDFNNILAGIMGNAELAELNVLENLPVDKELKNIVTSSLRAADLCTQMLAYSGQGTCLRSDVNMTALVEETIQLIDVSVSKNISLKLELSNTLPEVYADKTQMQQVVMNLVTNAAESIGKDRQGSITIVADLIQAGSEDLRSGFIEERREPGAYILFEVVDNGCGMDEETMGKMFDPFFTTKFTGRGLGMSAVLGIVRSHDGVIQVDSEKGKGSRFRVLLPVSDHAATTHLNENTEGAILPESGITVLVIDDEVMVRSVVERLLNKLGCKVLLAPDGEQGFNTYMCHREEIDLVLLDMTMPRMGGKETLERLRGVDAALPVFICSGYSNESISGQFETVQPNGVLQKPFTMKALNKAMSSWTQKG